MGGREREDVLRALTRHQWVRDQGVPRASAIVGEPEVAEEAWREWLRRGRRAREAAVAYVEPVGGGTAWLDEIAPRALAEARDEPWRPLAILVRAVAVGDWLRTRHDRVATFVAEGVVDLASETTAAITPMAATPSQERHVPPTAPAPPTATPSSTASPSRTASTTAIAPTASTASAPAGPPTDAARRPPVAPRAPRARSGAERALFDALEATPATAGRFLLNQSLSFSFGDRAAELDLLSRGDELAIEIDGYHHFTGPERYRRDRRKDLLLQAHGYVVLRFLAEDVLADPRPAVDAVVELLGIRRGRQERKRTS